MKPWARREPGPFSWGNIMEYGIIGAILAAIVAWIVVIAGAEAIIYLAQTLQQAG